MEPATRAEPRRGGFVAVALPCGLLLVAAAAGPADAAGCAFEPQGEGRVAAVIDARSFRLQDGREVRLAGIEPVAVQKENANRPSALAAIVIGRDVTLRGEDDTPDRYGRQPAFVRDAKRGTWADPAAIKNAESPGDILTGIGRFTVVEGKVLSVRQAGATTYLNFGRSWTQGFAVTISRRATAALEIAGMVVKSLENRRIRVRGWVEARGGPRIEVLRAGQIELLGEN